MTTTHVLLPPAAGVLVSANPGPDLATFGYDESEWTVTGTAPSYAAAPMPRNGQVDVSIRDTAEFTTRVLIRQPEPGGRRSGTLVVEWLNVSSGDDTAPDYTYVAEEIVRRGHVWVGISAQHVGVEGGRATVGDFTEQAGNGLRVRDPERYADLSHPGDCYSYGIFTEVVRGLTGPGGPLADCAITTRLAVGESQSAFALTTYVNAVHPLTGLFDGFLIHSRGAASTDWGAPDRAFDLDALRHGEAVLIRDDVAVPVITVQTETDVISPRFGFLTARQPDSESFRLWEIAGSAHADLWQIGEFEGFLGCSEPVNRGQQVYVVRAALRALESWARDGVPPASADRLEVDSGELVVDELGNARGGVRTPAVDEAVEVLTGLAAPDASVLCSLFGRTLAVPSELLSARYGDASGYLAAYETATDRAIAASFVLADDRPAVLADARPQRFT